MRFVLDTGGGRRPVSFGQVSGVMVLGAAAALAIAVPGAVVGCGRTASRPPGSAVVRTEYGAVRGSAADGTLAYLGIPFAAPPAGQVRWRPPAAPTPWQGE